MHARRSRRLVAILALAALLSLGADQCAAPDASINWFVRLFQKVAELDQRVEAVEQCTCCCEGVLELVCGENRRTYLNACEAECAGVRAVAGGACADARCGGPNGIPCREGEFCELPPGCQDPFAEGQCRERPQACPEIYAPVCGCDGITYGNDCERQAAGVPLAHPGECSPPACLDDEECPRGEFCEFRDCGGPDPQRPGACVPRPQFCPQIFDPVCGCDGVTYGNDCERRGAGVSKAHDGPCGEICGGFAGIPCPDPEQFCRFAPGTCLVADNAGSCVGVPRFCIAIFDPVCGCDGETYGNECEALRARVQIDHSGDCLSEAP